MKRVDKKVVESKYIRLYSKYVKKDVFYLIAEKSKIIYKLVSYKNKEWEYLENKPKNKAVLSEFFCYYKKFNTDIQYTKQEMNYIFKQVQ